MQEELLATLAEGVKNEVVFTSTFLVCVGYLLFWLNGTARFLAHKAASFLVASVTFQWADPSFGWLQQWMVDNDYVHTRPHSIVCSSRRGVSVYQGDDAAGMSVSLLPAHGYHIMRLNGRLVLFHRYRVAANPRFGSSTQEEVVIYVFGLRQRTIPFITELVRTIREHHESPKDGKTIIYVPDRISWSVSTTKVARSFDSVIWAGSEARDLLNDVVKFNESRDWYRERGINHQRGYLFYGPPGNGKSSMIAGLASKIGFSISILSLSSSSSKLDDSDLQALFSQLPRKTLLLIEDIDSAFSKSGCKVLDKEDEEEDLRTMKKGSEITFSGLLNALDGVGSADDRLLVMTTNHPERLDDALVREGRIDRKIYVGNVKSGEGDDQGARMFSWFFNDHRDKEELARSAEAFQSNLTCPVSGAAIQNYFLDRRDSMERARDEVSQLCSPATTTTTDYYYNGQEKELATSSLRRRTTSFV